MQGTWKDPQAEEVATYGAPDVDELARQLGDLYAELCEVKRARAVESRAFIARIAALEAEAAEAIALKDQAEAERDAARDEAAHLHCQLRAARDEVEALEASDRVGY